HAAQQLDVVDDDVRANAVVARRLLLRRAFDPRRDAVEVRSFRTRVRRGNGDEPKRVAKPQRLRQADGGASTEGHDGIGAELLERRAGGVDGLLWHVS